MKLITPQKSKNFILKHAIDVKVHLSSPEILPDGEIKETYSKMVFSEEFINLPAEVISFTEKTGPLSRKFPALRVPRPKTNRHSESTEDYYDKITDTPNSNGRMKLKFPMTASIKGPNQMNPFEDPRDYVFYSQTIEIQAFKDKAHETENKKKKETSKPGILRMHLFSDLFLRSKVDSHRSVLLKFLIDIEIDLKSEVPTILIMPDNFTRVF